MTKEKCGLYDEMPKVIIGKYSIAQFSESKKDSVFIKVEEGSDEGEGGQFHCVVLEKVIDKFFQDNF